MEAKLEKRLKSRVEALGGKCYKWTAPGLRGLPDRIVLLPLGQIYFVETKWGNNKTPSPAQKYIHKILTSLGFTVVVILNDEQLNNFIDGIQTT